MQTKGFMGRKWLWIDFGQVFFNAALKAHIDVKVDFFFIPKTWKFGGQNGLNWRAHTYPLSGTVNPNGTRISIYAFALSTGIGNATLFSVPNVSDISDLHLPVSYSYCCQRPSRAVELIKKLNWHFNLSEMSICKARYFMCSPFCQLTLEIRVRPSLLRRSDLHCWVFSHITICLMPGQHQKIVCPSFRMRKLHRIFEISGPKKQRECIHLTIFGKSCCYKLMS